MMNLIAPKFKLRVLIIVNIMFSIFSSLLALKIDRLKVR